MHLEPTYGRWTVVGPAGREVLCRCQCGYEKLVFVYDLLSGKSTKCKNCANRLYSSREERRAIYKVRKAARDAWNRCNDGGNRRYGGRGIRCTFPTLEAFEEHLFTLPGWNTPWFTLDRTDNDGDYAPGNLRWITHGENLANRFNQLDYLSEHFGASMAKLADRGVKHRDIASLYCESVSMVRRCIRRHRRRA